MSVEQVVELLSKGEALTTDDIARQLNIVEKADACKLMGNLKRAGTVTKKGDKWVLGPLVRPKAVPSRSPKVTAKATKGPSDKARAAVAKLNEQTPLPDGEAVPSTENAPTNADLPPCLSREITRLEQHLAMTIKIPSVRDPFIKTETLQRLAALMDSSISTVLLDIVKDLQRFHTLSKEVADATRSKA